LPDGEDVIYCSGCGKDTTLFPRQKEFYDHLATCGRADAPQILMMTTSAAATAAAGQRRNSLGRSPHQSSQQVRHYKDDDDEEEDDAGAIENNDDDDDDDSEDDVGGGVGNAGGNPKPFQRSRRHLRRHSKRGLSGTVSGGANGEYSYSQEAVKQLEDKLANQDMSVNHYLYNPSLKYPTCSICGENTHDLIPCSTCPCQYHPRCLPYRSLDTEDEMIPPDWNCPTCVRTEVADAVEIPDEVKRFYLITGAEIFCFFPQYRAWRRGIFITVHSQHENIGLIRFTEEEELALEAEYEPDAIQWIDIDASTILAAEQYEQALRSSNNIYERPYLYRKRQRHSLTNSGFDSQGFDGLEDIHRRKRRKSKRSFGHPFGLDDAENIGQVNGNHTNHTNAMAENALMLSNRGSGSNMGNADKDIGDGMTDTYISATSLKAALSAAGIACRGIDIIFEGQDSNVFCCIRPPGHHAGRHGCTKGCISTGFCLLNNAAIALTYARIQWGIKKIAVVDIDVHYGNGTADILAHDPDSFFASVHMIYGPRNDGKTANNPLNNSTPNQEQLPRRNMGFYPATLGASQVSDRLVLVGVEPENMTALLQKRFLLQRKRSSPAGMMNTVSPRWATQPMEEDEDENNDDDDELVSASEDNDEEKDTSTSMVATTSGTTATHPQPPLLSSLAPVDVPMMMDVTESSHSASAFASSSAPSATAAVTSATTLFDPANERFVGNMGFVRALESVVIPRLEAFQPELLIISGKLYHFYLFYYCSIPNCLLIEIAGFDGYMTDPLGGGLNLSLDHYRHCTKLVSKIIILLLLT
jgi:acetoin utilization deacetylase AcuC-like enzyme